MKHCLRVTENVSEALSNIQCITAGYQFSLAPKQYGQLCHVHFLATELLAETAALEGNKHNKPPAKTPSLSWKYKNPSKFFFIRKEHCKITNSVISKERLWK